MSVNVLKVENLDFFYKRDNPILNNFNLELKKGELKTIFGKSGSGKTTLFELILGNLKPQNGNIIRGKTAIIFQMVFIFA